jgi:hypothetical protein
MLPKFLGLSRRDAEMLSVSLKPVPAPPARDVVTVVRTSATSSPAEAPRSEVTSQPSFPDRPEPVRPAEPLINIKRDIVQPLNSEQSRFHVTVSRRFLQKLDAAKDALSHTRAVQLHRPARVRSHHSPRARR